MFLRKICMPLNSFHDLNKFIDILNNEFGSGDFMFRGNVKRKDLVEYGRWLKDSFYGTGDDVIYLKAADFIGYHQPESHWVLNREVSSKFKFYYQIGLANTPLMLTVPIDMCYNTKFHDGGQSFTFNSCGASLIEALHF